MGDQSLYEFPHILEGCQIPITKHLPLSYSYSQTSDFLSFSSIKDIHLRGPSVNHSVHILLDNTITFFGFRLSKSNLKEGLIVAISSRSGWLRAFDKPF